MVSVSSDVLTRRWLLLLSGMASLAYEVVWLRRLGLLLGGTQVAASLALGAFMGGLALGALWSVRLAREGGARPLVVYARLEAFAATWALAFPWIFGLVAELSLVSPGLVRWAAAAMLLPPATALGATWPVLARSLSNREAAGLYAFNTAGALGGVLLATFVALPGLGVRGCELLAAGLGALAAVLAWRLAKQPGEVQESAASAQRETMSRRIPWPLLALAAGSAGFGAMGLEIVWMRLSGLALGGSVQMVGLVLATFLGSVAAGAWLGRRFPRDPARGLGGALGAMGLLAIAGALTWGQLPFLTASVYGFAGPDGMLWASGLLAALAMFGSPVASGAAWSLAVRCLGDRLEEKAGPLYMANTLGSIAGSLLGGLWAVQTLEIHGAVALFALVPLAVGALLARSPVALLAAVLGWSLLPAWDGKLFAVGVHLRISDFADPSRQAVRQFADEGWELLFYDQGETAAVAVGRSVTTGNVWLSVNGKVDASTGDDMPTQELSAILPLRMAPVRREVLVVGLASGVTAGRALAEPGVERLTVVEIEPSIVQASHFFDHVNGRPLDDPRTTLLIDDARAVLQRPGPTWDVIISEPSNPWMTGVSNLFTREYWAMGRARLAPGGVYCQWVQQYAMGPEELRGLVRTFQSVFPDVWLFETIEGSDLLMVGGTAELPEGLPLAPLLDPAGVARLGGTGWLNTDDRPRVEFRAPRYLHYDTARANARLIEAAQRGSDKQVK